MRTFAGIPDEFGRRDHAKISLIPVPFDGTSTWGKGADRGPEAMLQAAENMELYDIETGSQVYKQGIFLHDPLKVPSSAEELCDNLRSIVIGEIDSGRMVTIIGGEHSVSIGSIMAHCDRFDDLTVLQIDAHADLRKEYEGSQYNHACALHWASQHSNLIQVGIRSMDISELEFMNKSKVFFAQDINASSDDWMEEVIGLCSSNVYITIDLDAFDPSILPSTGTPEPGGMRWYQVLRLLRMVTNRRSVVGFDIVELCPNEHDRSSDFLAAKLYYKLLTYIYE